MTNEYLSLAAIWRMPGNISGKASSGSDLVDFPDQAKKSVICAESFCRVEQ